MAEYVKKVLIFNEVKKGFAISGKAVSGILKVEKINAKTLGKIYITNFNNGNMGEVVAVVKIDEDEKRIKLTVLNDFEFELNNLKTDSLVDCLIAVNRGRETIPFLYATNRASSIADKLASSFVVESTPLLPRPAKVVHNVAPTNEDEGYEKFVAATDNYYLKENEVKTLDINQLLKNRTVESSADYENKFITQDNYYLSVANEMESLFEKYPVYEPLNKKIPNSAWVKIDVDNSYYVVGLITDDALPKYICYGLPSQFIVKSGIPHLPMLKTTQDDGFYILYQNASDGTLI